MEKTEITVKSGKTYELKPWSAGTCSRVYISDKNLPWNQRQRESIYYQDGEFFWAKGNKLVSRSTSWFATDIAEIKKEIEGERGKDKEEINKKSVMSRAHQLRRLFAKAWGVKISEIMFGDCLRMSWQEHKEGRFFYHNQAIDIECERTNEIARQIMLEEHRQARLNHIIDLGYDR